jgi:nucleoside-diphosphate-sugar epimerase
MRILLTGGAGFIGSNLAEQLLKDKRVSAVRVLDNLATGSTKIFRHCLLTQNLNLSRAISGIIRPVLKPAITLILYHTRQRLAPFRVLFTIRLQPTR